MIVYMDISCFDLSVDSSNKNNKYSNNKIEKSEFSHGVENFETSVYISFR